MSPNGISKGLFGTPYLSVFTKDMMKVHHRFPLKMSYNMECIT